VVTSTGTVPTGSAPGEEAPGSRHVGPGGKQDVDDLAVLVDRPVEVGPPPGDLQIRLIVEPPGAWRHGRTASMNSGVNRWTRL